MVITLSLHLSKFLIILENNIKIITDYSSMNLCSIIFHNQWGYLKK